MATISGPGARRCPPRTACRAYFGAQREHPLRTSFRAGTRGRSAALPDEIEKVPQPLPGPSSCWEATETGADRACRGRPPPPGTVRYRPRPLEPLAVRDRLRGASGRTGTRAGTCVFQDSTTLGFRHPVEGVVDLDRSEPLGVEAQHLGRRHLGGIERSLPFACTRSRSCRRRSASPVPLT